MADIVSINFDLEDLIDEVDELVEEALADGVEFARRQLLQRIPSQRRESRQAVTARVNGMQAEVGLSFPPGQRYQSRGTKTEEIVTRAWNAVNAPTLNVIENSFNDRLEEFQS